MDYSRANLLGDNFILWLVLFSGIMGDRPKEYKLMAHKKRIAWTGGTAPEKLVIFGREKKYYDSLVIEQFCDWFTFWGDFPNTDTQNLFLNRARYDAHAIMRELQERRPNR